MVYTTRMELRLEDVKTPSPNPDLRLEHMTNPSYAQYKELHDRVGAPYGWDRRARISDRAAIAKLLGTQGVELWRFMNGNDLIGYALFTCDARQQAELEDFGFFPEFTGCGYGGAFLGQILRRMKDLGIKTVWLTSRSTNHPKVIDFYKKAGFQVTGTHEIRELGASGID